MVFIPDFCLQFYTPVTSKQRIVTRNIMCTFLGERSEPLRSGRGPKPGVYLHGRVNKLSGYIRSGL